ncbi:AAA family ATPase [Hymenobacter actinosclerus]|uniref:AAA domain-containing protein, putative AbiEii toxin, Type IV TA system n=1 Tax=Hymenobacter actinosclerus TaxID=82805 RepID=A0A1I0DQ29_9BACT|nr:AAA family ATPase [Hymenobacter actinosclerus]SET34277.1 AAA domain-containing protein, putative AbiEii toxin, Type IV TA system [Hymenobacter actinosclerus]
MLKRLHLRNFTVFAEANFEFGPGLNVIVGTNGTGKSHVLKVGYAGIRSLIENIHDWNGFNSDSPLSSLVRIFRPVPEELSELIRRQAKPIQAIVQYELEDERVSPVQLILMPELSTESRLVITPPSSLNEIQHVNTAPVFIPAKEVFTQSWMLPASEQLRLRIDETYLDLLKQLRGIPLKLIEPSSIAAINSLSTVIGGEVEEEDGRYYLSASKNKRMEMNMVAEGLRKFGTLQKLLANGSLSPKSILFWDEPEANLNPALLRKLAAILAELARQGFQIILATHSMSLLKEFHILSRQKDATPLPIKYFGLNAGPGEATRIVTSDNFEYLPDVVALEAELEQADELDEIFAKEDRAHHANL